MVATIWAPHLGQKPDPSGISAPHLLQNIEVSFLRLFGSRDENASLVHLRRFRVERLFLVGFSLLVDFIVEFALNCLGQFARYFLACA